MSTLDERLEELHAERRRRVDERARVLITEDLSLREGTM